MVKDAADARGEPRLTWHVWWPMVIGALMGLVLRLLFSGDHGDAFEVMMVAYIVLGPIAVAAVAVYLAESTASGLVRPDRRREHCSR